MRYSSKKYLSIIIPIILLICCNLTSCVEYSKYKISLEGWNYCFDDKSIMDFIETELLILESNGCYKLDKDRYHNARQILRVKNPAFINDKLRDNEAFSMELSSNSLLNPEGGPALFFFKNNSYYYAQQIPLYRNTNYKNLYIFNACYASYNCGLYSLIFPHIDGYFTDSYNYQYVDYTWSFLESYYARFSDFVTIDTVLKSITITPIMVSNHHFAFSTSYEKILLSWNQDEIGNKITFKVI